MENKALVLERIPVRNNADDPRLRVLDIVLHDRSAGPVSGAGAARARTASLRARVERGAQDEAGLGVADCRLQNLRG
jgi:hypothetical protein